MKFTVIVLLIFSFGYIKSAAEDHWLKPQDYKICEEGYIAIPHIVNDTTLYYDMPEESETEERHPTPNNGDECNARWTPAMKWKEGEYNAYADYACCYVRYKMGNGEERKGCALLVDSKNERKKFKERALNMFTGVKIECSSTHLKIGGLILLFSLFL